MQTQVSNIEGRIVEEGTGRTIGIIKSQTEISGPLPDPVIIERYEALSTGAADRILKMAEEQMHHRIASEAARLNSTIKANSLGQVFGFIVFLVCILASIILAIFSDKTIACIFMCFTMIFVVGMFLGAKISIKRDSSGKIDGTLS